MAAGLTYLDGVPVVSHTVQNVTNLLQPANAITTTMRMAQVTVTCTTKQGWPTGVPTPSATAVTKRAYGARSQKTSGLTC